jgi:hypothetical protein
MILNLSFFRLEKVLKIKYKKQAPILHLDIWNSCYGQEGLWIKLTFWFPTSESSKTKVTWLWIENDIGKVFSMITTLFLKTLQLELVCESYELAKLQYSYIGKIKNFQYSLLKVLGLFVTLMHPPPNNHKVSYREQSHLIWWPPPKSRSWCVLGIVLFVACTCIILISIYTNGLLF